MITVINYIKYLTITFLLGIIITSCGERHNLTAEIVGLSNDTIHMLYMPVSQYCNSKVDGLSDTIISTNGKFVYDSPSKEPIIAYIIPKRKKGEGVNVDKSIFILLKPNDYITIKGKLHNDYLEYDVEGSVFNSDYCKIRNKYIKETSSQYYKIITQINNLLVNNENKQLLKKLIKSEQRIKNIREKEKLNFIKNNWNNDLSAYLLTRQNLDTIGKYHNKLNPDIRNGIFKDMLECKYLKYKEYVEVRKAGKKIMEGKIAPDFKLQSLSGNEFELSSIKNKYVVLDFWGSWCGACIMDFTKMKEYYNKYKGKIEIVGIACNDTEEKWKKSVKANQLNWIQVIDNKSVNKDMYGIESYPTKILLAKDKKIIVKFEGKSDEFYNKLDELMKK